MKTSTNLKLLLPEGKDPVNITDITSNFETLDSYLADMQTAASDASKNTVVFSQASDRQNIASTESLSTLMSKICKWFADLKAAAFCTVANNETTTAEGVVLDARVGKKHGDQLGGLYFKRDSNGKMGYATSETGSVTPFRNPTGNAVAAEVLSGKVFSSASLENASGTMANRGAWTGSTTGNGNVAIPEGYHNGSGYVSGAGAYNQGVTDADNRANADSTNYKTGYNAGVTYADGRTNTSSASYYAGTGVLSVTTELREYYAYATAELTVRKGQKLTISDYSVDQSTGVKYLSVTMNGAEVMTDAGSYTCSSDGTLRIKIGVMNKASVNGDHTTTCKYKLS